MVGRIVVGKAIEVEARLRLLGRQAGTDGWRRVPDAARAAFPSVERILAERLVHPIGRQR